MGSIQDQGSVPVEGKPRFWVEDGILYNKYPKFVDVSVGLEASQKSLELLEAHGLEIAPIITDLTQVEQGNFHLSLSDYAKIIKSFGLLRRLSGIWIVGAKGEVRKSIEIVNKSFLGGQIRFSDSIEDAKKEISQTKGHMQEAVLP